MATANLDYDVQKAQAEELFGRPLSDKEFAEALMGKIERQDEHIDCIEEANEILEKEAKERILVSDQWKEVMARVDEIMSIPAEHHEVVIRLTEEDISISFNVKEMNV